MHLYVDLQIATTNDANIPDIDKMNTWVKRSLDAAPHFCKDEAELTIRIVDENESNALNLKFRQTDKPTNVLSFPFKNPPGFSLPLLGDLVICQNIIEAQAIEQHKTVQAHWAHMVIHGTLHLLGYDHIKSNDALEMEALETSILVKLNLPHPYTKQ
ncbi:MAG: rRNA maturation RNase YbeY [Psychromonas sp.]|nr:rRNA maturation RNase YbeY [Psychromonas sp.]